MKIKFRSTTGFNPLSRSPAAEKVRAAAEGLPDEEVIDALELSNLSGVPLGTITNIPRELLTANRHIVRNKAWFGNSRTIAASKKQFP